MYTDSGGISDWSDAQSFTISGGAGSGFNEQFDGSSAPNWSQDSGTWIVSDGYYHANGGNLNAGWYGTSTYNADYVDCDYTTRLYRTEAAGNQYWGSSGRAGFFFDTETGDAGDHLWVDYAVLSTNVGSIVDNPGGMAGFELYIAS